MRRAARDPQSALEMQRDGGFSLIRFPIECQEAAKRLRRTEAKLEVRLPEYVRYQIVSTSTVGCF
jgi:hypothetical protein